ncbi:MAG: hypothetical protein JNK82_22490 [Myxococcaceae bacterium]|nr:hypothetical protein [Myxococcaceae bacterium]
MKFKVRTQEGELEFKSFGEVEQAWLMGLVGPDDELLEDGKTSWRKASSFPLLVQARRTGEQAWGGSWFLWTVIGILLGSAALWLIKDGHYLYGGTLGIMTAMVMVHVTVRASQRSRPHGVVTSSRPPSPARQRPPSESR